MYVKKGIAVKLKGRRVGTAAPEPSIRQLELNTRLERKTSRVHDRLGCKTSRVHDRLGCKTSRVQSRLGCKTPG